MVRYIPDNTGRFAQRPHYASQELDRECERIISEFLSGRYGKVEFPVSTDDLTRLIERDADDLDLYADLTPWGPEVEGLTEFRRGKKPRVKISSRLSEDARMENRLRTTLTHEYGHVRFHAYLWEMEPLRQEPNRQGQDANRQICRRDSIMGAAQIDWMEWQAGYACGALLMPRSRVVGLVTDYRVSQGLDDNIALGGEHLNAVLEAMRSGFQVSADAARIRLLKLEFLT